MRIVVYHSGYGCETGCCGHAILLNPEDPIWMADRETFSFDHPGYGEDPRAFAERLITTEMGAEHVADLDWGHCVVTDD